MSRVLPGQYIVPLYQADDSTHVTRSIAGTGTTVSTIHTNSKAGSISVIVAAIMGQVEILTSTEDPEVHENVETRVQTVSVVPINRLDVAVDRSSSSQNNTAGLAVCLPEENDIVLLRVTRINARQANGEILVVEKYGNAVKDSGVGLNGEFAHKLLAVGGGSQLLQSVGAVALLQTILVSANTPELGETFKGVIRAQDVRLTEKDKVRIIDSFKPGDIVRAAVILLGDGMNYYLSTARDDLGVIFAKSGANPMYALDWQHMVCEKTGEVEKRKCAKPFT